MEQFEMIDPCPVTMRGIVPSLNTPFDAEGRLDELSVRHLIDHTVSSGCQGMLAMAIAGEQGSMTVQEKSRFVHIAIEQNQNRIPLIVSVSSPQISESIELAKMARDAGANAICCQAPLNLTGDELLEALKPVADAGPELFMLQDLDWAGSGLTLSDIMNLYRNLPGFKCLKIETIPAGPKYSRVLEETGGAMHVSGGWTVSQLMDALNRGVHAFIPTGMEAVYVAIYDKFQAGKVEEARNLFNRLLPILAFSNQHIDASIRFFKALRKTEGLFTTATCRPQISALDEIQQNECDKAIATALNLIRG